MILRPQEIDELEHELRESLSADDLSQAIRVAERLSSRRVSRAVLEAPDNAVLRLLQSLPADRSGRVLGQLPGQFAESLLRTVPLTEAASLLSRVPQDYTTDLIAGMDADFVSELLDHADEVFRDVVTHAFPPGTAGSIMSPAFLSVEANETVGEALTLVKDGAETAGAAAYVYVLDSEQKPVGVVSIRDLVRHPAGSRVRDIMTTGLVAVRLLDSAAEAARTLRNRRFAMLPVLDDAGQIAGVIRFEHAIDILTDNAADRIVEVAGGSREESFFTPPLSAVRLRLPWMAANVFLNLGAVLVISGFEETIAAVAILAAFLPMITDMGGNIGIQALSIAIRSIALGEVRLRDFRKAMWKEMAIGVVNGLVLGTLFALIAYVWQGSPGIGVIAGVALAINVFVAGIVGGTIPFLVKRLGKDPALMTGPILTTITDITGVSIYLGLSTLFLLT